MEKFRDLLTERKNTTAVLSRSEFMEAIKVAGLEITTLGSSGFRISDEKGEVDFGEDGYKAEYVVQGKSTLKPENLKKVKAAYKAVVYYDKQWGWGVKTIK